MEPHTHTGAHFVVVLAGTYSSSAYGGDPVSRGPAVIFNPPGTEHRDCFVELDGIFMTVSLSACDFRRMGEARAPGHPVRLVGTEQMRTALALFRELTRSHHANLHMEALALELLDTALSRGQTEGQSRERAPAWLQRAMELIEDRYRERLELKDIAKEIGIHPVHLTRMFRRFLGQTPGTYHRRHRLERAAVLLSRGDRPLTAVGLEAGFSDQSHFTRRFREVYGLPPGVFRRTLPRLGPE